MIVNMTEIQQLHAALTQKGRRGALKEVGKLAGCKTRNDVTRVFLHGARSKYTNPCIEAAKKVLAQYEAAENYRASRAA